MKRRWTALSPLTLLVFAPGCLKDSTPEKTEHPLQFLSLVAPAVISAEDGGPVEVGFLVGPHGCWALERLGLVVDGDAVVISGTSVDHSRAEVACTQAIVEGTDTLIVPPLAPGTYTIFAGELSAEIEVRAGTTSSERKFQFVGDIASDEAGCHLAAVAGEMVALHDLPPRLAYGTYLVWGTITDDSPCDWVAPMRFRVEVGGIEPRG